MINIDLVLVIGQLDEKDNFHVKESHFLEWNCWNSTVDHNLSKNKFSTECESVNQILCAYDREEYDVAQLRLEINGGLPLILGTFVKDSKNNWIIE
jgi:hypothetical protein